MDIEVSGRPTGRKEALWAEFLKKTDLQADENLEQTVLVWDDGELIATGSRQGNVLKCIAVDPFRQGEGLTATVLTTGDLMLRQASALNITITCVSNIVYALALVAMLIKMFKGETYTLKKDTLCK